MKIVLWFVPCSHSTFQESLFLSLCWGSSSTADVGGLRCPVSIWIYCAVSVSQNLKFSVGRVFECPDFEFELDFDRQTPHSNSGQNPNVCLDRILSADVCLEPLIRSITYLIVEASPFSKWFWSFFAQLATPPPLGSSAILSKFVLDWPNTFDNFRRTFLKDIWNIIWFSKILRY